MAYSLQAKIKSEVIDKLLVVMKAADVRLEEQIAGLGTRVGAVNTWADRPTVDQNGKAVTTGDTFTLTTADDGHPAGIYSRKADNTDWNDVPDIDFDKLQISNLLETAKADPGAITVGADGTISATEDGKFTTPVQIKEALNALNSINDSKYHPKGGDQSLKVVGADADEGTQEFVTANQLALTYSQDDIQAQYDAL